MKRKMLIGVAAVTLALNSAFAADLDSKKKAAPEPPPPAKPLIAWPEPNFDFLSAGFDYAWGAKFMSDYIVRGISNSAHRPAGNVYGELRYGWFYAGTSVTNVHLPTSPSRRGGHLWRHSSDLGSADARFRRDLLRLSKQSSTVVHRRRHSGHDLQEFAQRRSDHCLRSELCRNLLQAILGGERLSDARRSDRL